MFGNKVGHLGRVGSLTLAQRVSAMFSRGEQGAWYDPSDMSTLFQDSAGSTPVTAVEQPVGRMLDKSGRGNHATQATTTKRPVLSRRVNLFTQTENVSDAAWNANLFGNWIINGARSAAAAPSPRGDFTATTISFTSPQGGVCVGQRAAVSPGIYRVSLWLRLTPGVSSPGSAFINIGVANGNANAWVAPYSNIQNIGPQLTESWKLFTLDHTVPASGVNQIELLINKGSSADSCSVDVWGASLTLATDAHLPYQRVNTATDYDADPGKFPAYLRFDGVDDAMVTVGNIDFTSTDKMTVWAGVTKLSDAAATVLVELSATANTNDGAFKVLAADPPGTEITASSRGTAANALNQVSEISAAAPGSFVISSASDIAGDLVALRVNSIAAPQAVGDQGAGNYGNYPLYIGGRAGAGLYFNGRLYSLIVRGAQSSLSQIEATEAYIKQKMRLP